MRIRRTVFLLLLVAGVVRTGHHHDDDDDDDGEETPKSLIPMPSKMAIEMIGVKFLDALIKKGQMEMAKGAFKTQLEVLEKVQPEQYKKYKKMSIDEMAADAVMQQAEMAKLQPKTGSPMMDMLNENGIPIASSLKGIEQAIKTQKDLENSDPSEQIAKAVIEKFQQQILPGLVANMIAGRNPFKIPQMRQPQMSPMQVRQMALEQARPTMRAPEIRRSSPRNEVEEFDDSSSLARRLRSSPRLRQLLQNEEVVAALSSSRLHDDPVERPLSFREEEELLKKKSELDGKAAVVLGLHDIYEEQDEDEDEQIEENSIRHSPISLPSSFIGALQKNGEVKEALEKLNYRPNDVDEYLKPKKLLLNPNPQPGYVIPRKLPKRPRKMLPLVVGMDSEEAKELRRNPSVNWEPRKSRVIQNLQNNPNIAPLFMDGKLEGILNGRSVLTDEQKGRVHPSRTIKALPRLFGAKTVKDPIDAKVTQMIEERPVPPLNWTPKGRHTRLRWTGATEREIPGIGARFILPSLDPTSPAVNTAYSTQGRARDEWDTIFKIPNNWQPGDEAGFSVSSRSQRFLGGNGGFDMPALSS